MYFVSSKLQFPGRSLTFFPSVFGMPNRTLLELGASPNYKDARGLTPLYLSITKKTDSKICESLLHDHGTLGIHDSQGWQEVHQVNCRNLFASLQLSNSGRDTKVRLPCGFFSGSE